MLPEEGLIRFEGDGAITIWLSGKAGAPDTTIRFSAQGVEFSGGAIDEAGVIRMTELGARLEAACRAR
jgi:hypothetical protein